MRRFQELLRLPVVTRLGRVRLAMAATSRTFSRAEERREKAGGKEKACVGWRRRRRTRRRWVGRRKREAKDCFFLGAPSVQKARGSGGGSGGDKTHASSVSLCLLLVLLLRSSLSTAWQERAARGILPG